MNRDEFLRQLERLLINVPENDRLDAIAYYNDYFDDAGVENEEKVILELGSPEKVAEKIKDDLGTIEYEEPKDYLEPQGYNRSQDYDNSQEQSYSQEYSSSQENTSSYAYENYTSAPNNYPVEKKKKPWALIIIILILTFPLWIGIVGGLFGALMGLIGALIGVICALMGSGFGLVFGGFGTMIGGISVLAAAPLEGVITIGVGAILTAIGLLLFLLFAWITFQWIPLLCKAIAGLFRRLFHKEEGGNEI